jgi:hypothetical protein
MRGASVEFNTLSLAKKTINYESTDPFRLRTVSNSDTVVGINTCVNGDKLTGVVGHFALRNLVQPFHLSVCIPTCPTTPPPNHKNVGNILGRGTTTHVGLRLPVSEGGPQLLGQCLELTNGTFSRKVLEVVMSRDNLKIIQLEPCRACGLVAWHVRFG